MKYLLAVTLMLLMGCDVKELAVGSCIEYKSNPVCTEQQLKDNSDLIQKCITTGRSPDVCYGRIEYYGCRKQTLVVCRQTATEMISFTNETDSVVVSKKDVTELVTPKTESNKNPEENYDDSEVWN